MGFWVSPNESLFWETLVFYRFKDAGVKLREANILSNWPWPPRLLQQWEFPPGSHSWLLDMGSQCAKKGTHKDGIDCLNVPSGPSPPGLKVGRKITPTIPYNPQPWMDHGWFWYLICTSFRGCRKRWSQLSQASGDHRTWDVGGYGSGTPQFWARVPPILVVCGGYGSGTLQRAR